MIFRIYHETRGAHVHMRLFAGPHDGALGKCGDLCMRENEFVEFIGRFAYVELRHERNSLVSGEKQKMDGIES
jgi:hypothetical protein